MQCSPINRSRKASQRKNGHGGKRKFSAGSHRYNSQMIRVAARWADERRYRNRTADPRARLALIGALWLLVLVLVGCSSLPYWIQGAHRENVLSVDRVAFEDFPRGCNRPFEIHGCTVFTGSWARIYVVKGLHPAYDRCIEIHERQHAAGRHHPIIQLPYVDCGDGTFFTQDGRQHYPTTGG